MTDKEKLKKIKKLADAMYYAAQQLTTDASRLHKAMDEYHQFIIHECKEEPKTDWLQEFQERLDSLSKEDFEKVWAKYKLREEGSVNYDKLNTMLDDALAKETKESLNERLGKKDFRERYKRIAQSESFKKAHEGISIGDVVPVECEEPVNNDFEMALAEMIYKAQTSVVEPLVIAAQWKDELIKLAKSEESVNDDLEEAARNIRDRLYLEEGKRDEFGNPYFLQNTILKAVIMGAQWQKEQLLAKAVDVTIAIPYPNGNGSYTQLVYSKEALPFGDNIKVLIIKEGWLCIKEKR